MKRKLTSWLVPSLIFVLIAAPAAWAVISVDEIVRLQQAGLSERSLLLVVSSSDTPDTLTTDQLNALLDANVPDTVIQELVTKADAVMEDWQPIDLDQELEPGGRIYTETEVRYVYPSRSYYYNDWGWYDPWYDPYFCATPYYGWYRPWRPYWGGYACASPYYGWYGGWSVGVGIGWGWGWGGYVSIGWNWGPSYGWCGWNPGPVCYSPYYVYNDPYYGGDGYYYGRDVSRPDYRRGAQRGTTRGSTRDPGDSFTNDPTTGDVRRELARADRSTQSTVERAKTGKGRYELRRDELFDRPSTKSDLQRISADRDKTATLERARVDKGRYTLRGDPDLKPVGEDRRKGQKLSGIDSKTADRGTDRNLRRDSNTPTNGTRGGVRATTTQDTKQVTSRYARTTRSSETRAQKLERYRSMKDAQRGIRRPARQTSTNSVRRAGTSSGTTRKVATRSNTHRSSTRSVDRSSGRSTSSPKIRTGSKSTSSRSTVSARSGARPSAPTVRSSSPTRSAGGRSVSRGGGSRGSVRAGGSRSGGRKR